MEKKIRHSAKLSNLKMATLSGSFYLVPVHVFDGCFLFLMPLLVLDQKWLILSSISYINTTWWVCRPIQLGGGVRKIASSRLAWGTLEVLFQEESYISNGLQVFQVLKMNSEFRPRCIE